jgi:peptide/nickel transport system substrate-binding protein
MGRALAAGLAAWLLFAVPSAGGSGAQAPRVGGTLVFGTQGAAGGLREPPCLNALLAKCHVLGLLTAFVSPKVLLGAFEAGPDYTWRPSLVSGSSFTRTRPFTITYEIHPEARWSDGVPITARDFVFTHNAILGQRAGVEDTTHLGQVRSVRAVGAKTVRVVLRSRFAGWRGLFSTVLPSHALAGQDLERTWLDGIDNPKTGGPIGSGPFLVERWERDKQIVLRRNPRYWGPRGAYLDRLMIRYRMSSTKPVDWFRSREVDVAQHFPAAEVPSLRRERGVRIVPGPQSGYEAFTIRVGPGGHPALRRALVRRALAHGIDRTALIRGSPFSDADPTLRPLESVVFQPQSPHYRPKWSSYRHSPGLARQLLERAGCRRADDGIYQCAGERLSLRFVTSAGLPARARVLELVQSQLKQSGVEVRPEFVPAGILFGQRIPSGAFDVWYGGWVISSPTPADIDEIYGCEGIDNFGGYCQRLLTRELDQADQILDGAKQARVLNRADAQMAREVPVIPFVQIPFPAAVASHVRNVTLSPFNPLANAEDWWVAPER